MVLCIPNKRITEKETITRPTNRKQNLLPKRTSKKLSDGHFLRYGLCILIATVVNNSYRSLVLNIILLCPTEMASFTLFVWRLFLKAALWIESQTCGFLLIWSNNNANKVLIPCSCHIGWRNLPEKESTN